jgi:DUF971 family protein
LVGRRKRFKLNVVRPTDIQPIGEELAIKWDDGSETFIRLETLRRACPCAGCQGERDIMGNLHKGPPIKLTSASFRLERLAPVGAYGVQPVWADGHNTGLFTYDYLWELTHGGGKTVSPSSDAPKADG